MLNSNQVYLENINRKTVLARIHSFRMTKNRAAQQQIAAYEASQNTSSFEQQCTLTSENLAENILPRIKIVTGKTIRIQGQVRPTIIRDICHISFPNLQYLNLNNNRISNIESIRYFSCPNLTLLELYNNFITNLNPLANATQLRGLQMITIYGNPIKEKWRIERELLPLKKRYELDYSAQDFECTIEDLSFLVKALSGRVMKTNAYGKGRIKQRRLTQTCQVNLDGNQQKMG